MKTLYVIPGRHARVAPRKVLTILAGLFFIFAPRIATSDDWFPYEKGTFWDYEGELSSVDYATGLSATRFITWRSRVEDVFELGDYRIALVNGLPIHASLFDGYGSEEMQTVVILSSDGGIYEISHPNGELFMWHLRNSGESTPPAAFLSPDRLSLRKGMQVGEKFNPLDDDPNRAPGHYNFGVETIESISQDLPPRVRAVATGNQYHLSIRTNSDSQTKVFTPGIGYTEVELSNHRGPTFSSLKLVATGNDPSGLLTTGLIEQGAPMDDQGNFVPTVDLIDDFLDASSKNERLSDFRRIFFEKARHFGKKKSVEEIIAEEAEYHEKWPYRSLERSGILNILDQSEDSVTFEYQFDFVVASLDRAERRTGRHTMEMIVMADEQEVWRIASLHKVDEMDLTPPTVMGEHYGNLNRDSTVEQITAMLGPENVQTEFYQDPDDGTEYASSLIFPESPGEVTVHWVWGRPFQLSITRSDSGFHNPGGLHIGMSLAEAETANKGEIAIYGFDWDFAGAMTSWKGGLMAQEHAIDHLFQATFTPSRPAPTELQGPVILSSQDPALRALEPTITELTYYFADDPMHIGGIYLDLVSLGVDTLLPEGLSLSDEELNGVDGTYRQTWAYPDRGIFLDMYSLEPGGEKSVSSVSVLAPCPLKTDRGIGIGDTFEEVALAYADLYSDENAYQDDDTFVAGSIYGGTLFYFENGRVREIFLGAAAE